LTLSLGDGLTRIALKNDSDYPYSDYPYSDYPSDSYALQDVNTIFDNLLTHYKDDIVSNETFHQGLGFVSQEVSKADTQRIINVLNRYGLTDIYSPEKYHFSLCYDNRNIIKDYNEMSRSRIIPSYPTGMKLLTPSNASDALSLVFKSNGLEQRVKELNDMGFVCMYGDFIAHISIKYSPTKKDIEILTNNIDSIMQEIGAISCGVETWDIFQ